MDNRSGLAVPYKGLEVGSHHFTLETGDGFFEAFEDSPVMGGKVAIEVEVLRRASGMSLEMKVMATARVECDRCLEPLELPVQYEGGLEVRVDPTREGEYDGEQLFISGNGDADIAQWVYESVCLGLPMSRVHGTDEDGNPLCDPDMLSRFKIVTQSEFDEIEAAEGSETIEEKTK